MGDVMRIWGPLLALVPVWFLAAFGPGMLVVRRLRWDPMERLCAGVAASLFMIYLAALGIYLAGVGRWGFWAVLGGTAVAAAWCWRDWVRLINMRSVRRALLVLVVVMAWATLCLGIVQHYSGAGWAVDWALHYQKVELFLRGAEPLDLAVVREKVIDRPALMNLVATYLCGVVGARFDVFQVSFSWLNVLAVLPCCMIARSLGRRGGQRLWYFVALLVCLPTFWVQATYSWNKQLSAFYELVGIALYLRALRKGDRGRMVAAFAAMAAGVLVHYVGMPYAALAAGHYVLFVWWRRRGKWAELAMIVGCSLLVLGTWFGWAAVKYGVGELATANNTLRHASGQSRYEVVMRAARTYVWDIVPPQWRTAPRVWEEQSDTLGRWRDYFFLMYQMNRVFVTGTATGVVAAVLLYRRLRFRVSWDGVAIAGAVGGAVVTATMWGPAGSRVAMEDLFPTAFMKLVAVLGGAAAGAMVVRGIRAGRERPITSWPDWQEVWFWRGMLLFIPVAAAVTLDIPGMQGTGHVYFQAWALLAVTLVGVGLGELSRGARVLLGIGMAVDFVLGVFLQFYLENLVFELSPDGVLQTFGMSTSGPINWAVKVRAGWVFLGDRLASISAVLEVVLLIGGLAAAVAVGAGWRLAKKREVR